MRNLAHLSIALLLAAFNASAAAPTANSPEEAAVLKDSAALSSGDVEGLLAVLSPEFRLYKRPTEPHALTGPISDRIGNREQVRSFFTQEFKKRPLAREEVVDMVSLGELVVARVMFQAPTDPVADHMLTVFRVRHGLIDAIWHIAREEDAAPQSGAAAQAVIRRFAAAADARDVETFLGLFSPEARNFHFRNDPETLGGGPSKSLTDPSSRERVLRRMFAGPPVRIEIVDSLALGEWVVSRDRATRSDGTVLDELSIYRVRDGKIIDDWYVAEQLRQ